MIAVCVVGDGSFKKKCVKDDTVPEYPVNVYYCYDESKTVCCVEDKQYTCCEPQESLKWFVQLQYCRSVITDYESHLSLTSSS